MQLHGVEVAVSTPIVPQLFEHESFELCQFPTFAFACFEVFYIGVYLGRSLLVERFLGDVELLDGKFSRFFME